MFQQTTCTSTNSIVKGLQLKPKLCILQKNIPYTQAYYVSFVSSLCVVYGEKYDVVTEVVPSLGSRLLRVSYRNLLQLSKVKPCYLMGFDL